MSAPHARTRERALALYEITHGCCATRVAARTGRHPQTVMGWVHAYNAQGPDALGFRRTGGRPPLRSDRSGASRRRLRRPAYGGHPTPRRSRPGAALDPEAAGAVCARALRPPLLSRDDPHSPAPPQAVVEDSQEAAGPSRPGAATSVHRAAPGRAGRRSTRPASRGLRGRGAHPPGRGSRLWLGRARRALLGRLPLAGSVGADLVLWALPVQRGPGAAVAFPARQRRPHDRGAAAAAGRVPR